MKRICLLALALLLLAACGTAEVATTVAPTTVEATAQPMWAKTLFEDAARLVYQKHLLSYHYHGYAQEIWLRDNVTNEETLLLAQRPDGTFPRFDASVYARYFSFRYGIPGTYDTGGLEFYDLEKRRAIALDCGGDDVVIDRTADEKVFLRAKVENEDERRIYAIDLAALDGDSPIKAERLLPPPLKESKTHMETADSIVFEKASGWSNYFPYRQELWLRDTATGEEALLLGYDDLDRGVPYFSKQVNERYFAYFYGLPDTDAIDRDEIYDLQKRNTVEIERPEWIEIVLIADGKIYFKTAREYGDDDATIKTYAIDIAALDADGPVIPKEVR
ncbi:MAG: hypothetical protein FWE98_06885 [Oscillospiraceae bacterium]|nr:hypothetical protein [Oscillospiraceae bacterium]